MQLRRSFRDLEHFWHQSGLSAGTKLKSMVLNLQPTAKKLTHKKPYEPEWISSVICQCLVVHAILTDFVWSAANSHGYLSGIMVIMRHHLQGAELRGTVQNLRPPIIA